MYLSHFESTCLKKPFILSYKQKSKKKNFRSKSAFRLYSVISNDIKDAARKACHGMTTVSYARQRSD